MTLNDHGNAKRSQREPRYPFSELFEELIENMENVPDDVKREVAESFEDTLRRNAEKVHDDLMKRGWTGSPWTDGW